MPPLRERLEDIPLLLNFFLEQFARQYQVERPNLGDDAMQALCEHAWPGNVRELKNVVERLVVRARSGEIHRDDLPLEVLRTSTPAIVPPTPTTRAAADVLLERLVNGGESFWSCVYTPFMSRDLTRDDLRTIVRKGLERTSGNYKVMVELFNMPATTTSAFSASCESTSATCRSSSSGRPRAAATERKPDSRHSREGWRLQPDARRQSAGLESSSFSSAMLPTGLTR